MGLSATRKPCDVSRLERLSLLMKWPMPHILDGAISFPPFSNGQSRNSEVPVLVRPSKCLSKCGLALLLFRSTFYKWRIVQILPGLTLEVLVLLLQIAALDFPNAPCSVDPFTMTIAALLGQ